MKLYTLDNLVRSALADLQLPMHYYLQFLTYGIDSFRELNFDVLQNMKSVRLPVNSYGAATLPCDFVDWARVGNEYGQYIERWEPRETFNRLNDFDASGNKEKYPDVEANGSYLPFNYLGLWFTSFANDKGELLGRIFNAKPSFRKSFQIVRERGEIQLDVAYQGATITMDYISDGVNSDATTAIHPYAFSTIKAYIIWKYKLNSRRFPGPEKSQAEQEYFNNYRILRARMNPIDIDQIRRSLGSAYGPTVRIS